MDKNNKHNFIVRSKWYLVHEILGLYYVTTMIELRCVGCGKEVEVSGEHFDGLADDELNRIVRGLKKAGFNEIAKSTKP